MECRAGMPNDDTVLCAQPMTLCGWQDRERERGAPLVGVDVAVVEDVDAVLVHEGLQHHPHLLVLLEGGVGGVQGVVVAGNHPAQLTCPAFRPGLIATGESAPCICRFLVSILTSACYTSAPGSLQHMMHCCCSSRRS